MPVNGLPATEYVELLNYGNTTIQLEGIHYRSVATSYTFQRDSILPGEHLILCRQRDTSLLKPFGRVIGLAPWPVPTNAGTTLSLITASGFIIDEVSYSDSWYQHSQKNLGGWSLERKNPAAACLGIDNWAASTSPYGGTPGRENTLFSSIGDTNLQITNISVENRRQLLLHFNLDLDEAALASANYSVNLGVGAPEDVIMDDLRTVQLHFAKALPGNRAYRIHVHNLADCAKRTHQAESHFFVNAVIQPGDILINEILPNPRNEGVSFVEIYNHAEYPFDLQELSIGRLIGKDSITQIVRLSNQARLFEPQSYLVLTTDSEKVMLQYENGGEDTFHNLPRMPQTNNRSGGLVLLSEDKRIDQLFYREDMHSPLINDAKGVSLERRSFAEPSQASGNFTSAASTVGYATPGYRNSQHLEAAAMEDEIWLDSKTFSPDHDGHEDILKLNYALSDVGYFANVLVFDNHGNLVRRLYRNKSLGTSGQLLWDGRTDSNHMATVGIYTIHIALYHPKGMTKTFKKSCVLAIKF